MSEKPGSDDRLSLEDLEPSLVIVPVVTKVQPDDRFLSLEIDGVDPTVARPVPVKKPLPVPPPIPTRAAPAPVVASPVVTARNPIQASLETSLGIVSTQPSNLIHGVFNPMSNVYQNLFARLSSCNLSRQFTWATPQVALGFTNDPEVVPCLCARLSSPGETFEFYTDYLRSSHPNSYRYEGLRSDAKYLRLWNNQPFQPNTLSWSLLKLNANFQKSPKNVRTQSTILPGLEVLAVAAHHPERVRKMNGTAQRPHLWMGGLECSIPDYRPWKSVPYVWWHASTSKVDVHAYWHGNGHSDMAVPAFVGGT